MKILLLSDSHRCMERMERAVALEQPDAICHMGDHLADAKRLKVGNVPLYAVPGNCDFSGMDTPLTKVVDFNGVSVMLTHGHAFGVKQGLLTLELAAKERGVDVVAFGHTHMAVAIARSNLWMVNPGSCGGGSHWSYGVLTIEAGVVSCNIIEMEG
ncbi:MAG: metallophosphoesterase [Eubacteriales bacterium]